MPRTDAGPGMRISTRAFHVHKRGGTEDEYEDAFFPDGFAEQVRGFRCAVADGASESAFASQWAQLLVDAFGRRELHLAHLQAKWQKSIGGKRLPWFLEKKARRGAFAALIGLSIRAAGAATARARIAANRAVASVSAADWMPQAPGSRDNGSDESHSNGWHTGSGCHRGEIDGTWRAIAVGDSCLFQVRDDELITVGPLSRSDQFDNSPFLLGSKSAQSIGRNAPHVSVHAGTWSRNDRFYLATDAMAQWLLLRDEAGLPPWTMLRELGEQDTLPFDELVTEMRLEHDLHNDDTTLLRVEVS
ncbi:MAG: hypothetical protein IID28_08995 [Planctomycetes bacterium]|nr:hypothetical protein [Planctomycetota bacterium]